MARGHGSKKALKRAPGHHKFSRKMGPVGGRRNIGHTSSMTHRKYGRRGGK